MPPSTSAARIATLPGPELSRQAIDALAGQISTDLPQSGAAIVIDCHSVRVVSAAGLSALLDLRARHEAARWALVALSRPMLAAVLELGLAERFTICVDVPAAQRVLTDEAR